MKAFLERLYEHESFSREESRLLLMEMASGRAKEIEISAVLSALNMRNISPEELLGFREALLELAVPVDLSEFDPLDLCGTGGDNKHTFNISTTAAFVVAGAGYYVAKHGNYAVSSSSGSSNVMEYFGISFTNEISKLKKSLEQCHFVYLHAPLFHPAMKNVAPVRRQLGVKTIFNMMGPLVNPARVKKQLIGVYHMELLRLFKYVLQENSDYFYVLHSIDGYDEISLTAPAKYVSPAEEGILSPDDLGLPFVSPAQLHGGNSSEEAASVFYRILNGEGTPAQNNVVLANAAMAIKTANPNMNLAESLEQARESLFSGKALQSFRKFRELMSN